LRQTVSLFLGRGDFLELSIIFLPLYRKQRAVTVERKLAGRLRRVGEMHGNVCVLYVLYNYAYLGMVSGRTTDCTECWPCPVFDILLISISLLASLVAGRRPQCTARTD
jgi:hypothetical protein